MSRHGHRENYVASKWSYGPKLMPATYGHCPQAAMTANRSSMLTSPSPFGAGVTSAGQGFGGKGHGPQAVMTAKRSSTSTDSSPLRSAGQDGGQAPPTVSVAAAEVVLPHSADPSTQS